MLFCIFREKHSTRGPMPLLRYNKTLGGGSHLGVEIAVLAVTLRVSRDENGENGNF